MKAKPLKDKLIDCRIIVCLSGEPKKQMIDHLKEIGENVNVRNLRDLSLELKNIKITQDGLRFFITDSRCLVFERTGERAIVWASEVDVEGSELTELLVYMFEKLWEHSLESLKA